MKLLNKMKKTNENMKIEKKLFFLYKQNVQDWSLLHQMPKS